MDEKRQEQPGQGDSAKKPYVPPMLIVHGSIETLTQAVGLAGNDGLTGSRLL